MRDFRIEPKQKKVNKKKIVIATIIGILLITLISMTIIYINNKEARNWIDKNIFQKEKTQNNLPSIEIDESDSSNIYAFNKYIGILNKNNFQIYDNTAKKENKLTIEISKPIFTSNNRYLAIAEEKGQKLYLIEDRDIAWETEVWIADSPEHLVHFNGYKFLELHK